MKATLLAKENGDAKFTIEFTAEEFEAARVKAYQENKNQILVIYISKTVYKTTPSSENFLSIGL